MAIIHNNYLARKSNNRNWWLVKQGNYHGIIYFGKIYLPKELIGKRLKFKVELID